MPTNKFEKKALNQIDLNEGLISTIAKFFMGSDFHKSMREVERMKQEDPSLKAGLASFYQNYKLLMKQLDTICKENPNLKNCKDR
jgi:hypothetical protein